MAYTGGIYTKPIDAGTDKLAAFYRQGVQQIADVKMKVAAIRGEELKNLGETIKDVEATGIADIDKLVFGQTRLLTDAAGQAHQDNRDRKINLTQSTAKVNNYNSQAALVANFTKTAHENIQQLQEGVDKGDLSAYSLDRYMSGAYFVNNNLYPPKYVLGDGTEIEVRNTYLPDMVDGNVGTTRIFNYVGPDGKEAVASQFMSTQEAINTNPKKFKAFNITDWTTDYNKTIGKRIVPNYNDLQVFGGTTFLSSVVDTGSMQDVKNTTETYLNAVVEDDDFVLSVLTGEFGARAPGQQNFRGKYYSTEELNEKFGNMYDENQEFFKDKEGFFKVDPTVLTFNERGREIITDEQREFVKGYLRDRAYRSLDISVDTLRSGGRTSGSKTPDDTTLVVPDLSANYYVNTMNLADALSQEDLVSATSIQNSQAQNIAYDGYSAVDMPARIKNVIDLSGTYIDDKNSRQFMPLGISGDISKNLLEDVSFVDYKNHEAISIEQIIISQGDPDQDNPFIRPEPVILFLSNTEFALSDEEYQLALKKYGKEGLTKYGITENKKIIGKSYGVYDKANYQKLYEELFKTPGFEQDMASLGYVGLTAAMPRAGKEGQYAQALATYTERRRQFKLPSQKGLIK